LRLPAHGAHRGQLGAAQGASLTHGNAGYLTYFRNYASSQFSPSLSGQSSSAIVWSQPFLPQYANVEALQFDTPDLKMTVVGNVLGSTASSGLGLPADLGTTSTSKTSPPATSNVYTSASGSELAIFGVDTAAVPWTSIWLHGNFDTVNRKVLWNASALTANLPASTQDLPASLYDKDCPPRWWQGTRWPWAGPDLAPMVGTLPAKARSEAFDYQSASDPACTLNCGAYCCHVGPSCP
jgi:hypothetical protein